MDKKKILKSTTFVQMSQVSVDLCFHKKVVGKV